MNLKFTEELCVMTVKKGAKFEKELKYQKNLHFNGLLLTKVYNAVIKIFFNKSLTF